eukprot:371645-Rhodomonas_salina.1
MGSAEDGEEDGEGGGQCVQSAGACGYALLCGERSNTLRSDVEEEDHNGGALERKLLGFSCEEEHAHARRLAGGGGGLVEV